MLVLDASALLEVLLGRPGAERISDLLIDRAPGGPFLSNAVESAAVSLLRRYRTRGELSEERAQALARAVVEIPAVRHGFERSSRRVWQLTKEMPTESAAAVALAEDLGVALVTCDPALESVETSAEVLLIT